MLRLVLASQSPRRRDLLMEAGYDFDVDHVKVSEIIDENLTPDAVVLDLARQKALTALAMPKYSKTPGFLVLGADTLVILDGQALGKPKHIEEAHEFLGRLSGQTHSVMTGFYLGNSNQGPGAGAVEISKVTFRQLSRQEILDYVASGEPMDKAGAYAIQGHGGKFVSRLEGSRSNVVGLPLERLESFLKEHGWIVSRKKS
jgi:septum formation protein